MSDMLTIFLRFVSYTNSKFSLKTKEICETNTLIHGKKEKLFNLWLKVFYFLNLKMFLSSLADIILNIQRSYILLTLFIRSLITDQTFSLQFINAFCFWFYHYYFLFLENIPYKLDIICDKFSFIFEKK